MSEAPDGSPLEVRRNFGKPNTAAQLLERLRAGKKAGKAVQAAVEEPDVQVKPAPAHADELHALAEQIRKERKEKTPTPPPARTAKPKAPKAAQPKPAEPAPAQATAAAPAEPAPAEAAPAEAPAKAKPAPPPRPPLDTKGMQPKHVVEAALFSAGKPLLVEEIAQETKLSPETIKKAVKDLQADYEGRDTVLEVGKAGAKWAMQVRSRAAEPAARFAPMEIAPKLLKTLALVAYHQPMRQSELVDMIGTKVYDHIPELVERGLVRAREEGATKILATTPAFPEYFGLDAEDTEGVRAALAKLVGLPPPPPKAKEAQVAFEEPQAQAAPDAGAPAEGDAAADAEAQKAP